jgi:hypothetical protein
LIEVTVSKDGSIEPEKQKRLSRQLNRHDGMFVILIQGYYPEVEDKYDITYMPFWIRTAKTPWNELTKSNSPLHFNGRELRAVMKLWKHFLADAHRRFHGYEG